MLLPATHLYTSSPLSAAPSSSSLLFFFPIPFSKTLISIPRNPKTPKFLVRSSAVDTRTLPKSAIQRIADKLRSLGFTEETSNPPEPAPTTSSAGEIFIPFPHQLPKQRVGHTIDPSWSTPENPVPNLGTGTALVRHVELTNEVNNQKKLERVRKRNKKEEKVPTLAELSLSNGEIARLATLGMRMKQKLKVGKAGITEGIVNGIHERWRRSEVVKIVADDICRVNMKRTHELLERKTGGLVVWRSGSKIILYRGTGYKYPYFLLDEVSRDGNPGDALQHSHSDDKNCDEMESNSSATDSMTYAGQSSILETKKPALIQGVGVPNKVRFQLPGEAELTEEADRLLMGLGPRFTDWWGYDPLPVDADLLPAVIPGYRKPFRLLPYGVKSKLTDDELTMLKRLSKPLPCHFALGRNRKHQGLAAAIIKLWERCEIVKIAVKRGVQNTNSKLMAEELKYLTGGTLLARDKFFIVLYRGKDFLPPAVSSAIEQRRKIGTYKENLKAKNSSSITGTPDLKPGTTECGPECNGITLQNGTAIFELKRLTEKAIKRTSIKLSLALKKKAKAEKILAELENVQKLQEAEVDNEGITKEEKYMLRKIGLKMKPFLLLGRRGVFDGTVENIHLHWKYRELVKIICKVGSLESVNQIAQTLETESGGILVAVERVNKGYAIILYRGKNYSRPACLRPQTLLSKRAAMKRSIEAQRRESLKLHVLELNKRINELELQMVKDTEANSKQTAEALKFDLARVKHGSYSNSMNLNSPKEASANDQPASHEGQVELIEDSGACQIEADAHAFLTDEETINLNSPKEDSANGQPAAQHGQFELIDDGGACQREPEAQAGLIDEETMNVNSPKDASANDQPATQLGQFELADDDGACQREPEAQAGLIDEETINLNSPKEASANDQPATQQGQFELIDDGGACQREPEAQAELIDKETQLDGVSDYEVIDTRHLFSIDKAMESSVTSLISYPELSAPMINRSLKELSSRSVYLSNRERLVLRKQALKMRKRPVFAIGKSNIVTGVAKAIKAHFQKHPLAIVNVKGRAKGTSVQEVVFKLEQATGAILVSQEPSKVILYRGWGAGDKPGPKVNVNDMDKEEGTKPSVSPELLEAIRVECGLQ